MTRLRPDMPVTNRLLLAGTLVLSLLAHVLLLLVLASASGHNNTASVDMGSVEVSLIQRNDRPAASRPVSSRATGDRGTTPAQTVQPQRSPLVPAQPEASAITLSSSSLPEGITTGSGQSEPFSSSDGLPNRGGEEAATIGSAGLASALVGTPDGRSGTEADGIIPPTPRRTERPAYPVSARMRGWEGDVLLRVLVDQTGGVSTVRVERSSGHDILDQAASRAIRSWLFQPARHGLQTITAEVRVPVQFRLAEL